MRLLPGRAANCLALPPPLLLLCCCHLRALGSGQAFPTAASTVYLWAFRSLGCVRGETGAHPPASPLSHLPPLLLLAGAAAANGAPGVEIDEDLHSRQVGWVDGQISC